MLSYVKLTGREKLKKSLISVFFVVEFYYKGAGYEKESFNYINNYRDCYFDVSDYICYKIGLKYSEALQSDKPMLALMYVDWCGYCLRFMPKYKTVSKIYKDKFNIVMLNAEDPANEELVKDVALSGFPTLYIIDPKYDNRVLLNNAIYMDLKKLRVELDRYLRIRGLLDQVPVK